MNRRSFLAGLCGLFGLGTSGVGFAADASMVEKLIAALGSKNFNKREAASRALEKRGARAMPALGKAAKDSRSNDVRRQASALAGRIDAQLLHERVQGILNSKLRIDEKVKKLQKAAARRHARRESAPSGRAGRCRLDWRLSSRAPVDAVLPGELQH